VAEKKLTPEELDQVGLECININWENPEKLTKLFEYFAEKKSPLPTYCVNNKGDATPNLSQLARLGKIISGKQVFRGKYANDLLIAAIKNCGIEDLSKQDEKDETKVVRRHMQDSIDEARRNASNTDKKLQDALVKVDALTEENKHQAEEIIKLNAKLTVVEKQASIAEQRVIIGNVNERSYLKRVF